MHAFRTQALAHLARLVAHDTTSRLSNLPLIADVEEFLASHGVASHRVPNADGSKASLVATIPSASGEALRGGIVLSGHTDVVPVDGQPWHTDPFELTASDDGKYYGRGTCDMKGFGACALAMVEHWVANPPPCPIHLAFSYDEEIGCLAAPALAAHMLTLGWEPSLIVVGEPTEMQLVDAHKGIRSFETVVTGHESHSSNTHLGVNAVMIAAELIHYLNQQAAEFRTLGDDSGLFSPPYTTVHVGVVQGGTARNIIPRECRFLWEVRPLPQHDAGAVIDRFRAHCEAVIAPYRSICPDVSIVSTPASNVAGLRPMPPSALMTRLLHATGGNRAEAVSFGTEAGIFQQAGFPVIVCGPGSIEQAHKPNEFVHVEQLDRCLLFLQTLPGTVAAI